MLTFETLDFPNMMGNLASELARVERVLKKHDEQKIKDYLWISLELSEQIKIKFPNTETFRLYEYLASFWIETPDLKSLQALEKYALDFYLESLK